MEVSGSGISYYCLRFVVFPQRVLRLSVTVNSAIFLEKEVIKLHFKKKKANKTPKYQKKKNSSGEM